MQVYNVEIKEVSTKQYNVAAESAEAAYKTALKWRDEGRDVAWGKNEETTGSVVNADNRKVVWTP